MKEFAVEAFFPEAVSHAANQSAKVRANRLDLAAKNGLSEILKRSGIKGKRIATVRLTICFIRKLPFEWIVKTYKLGTPENARGTMHEEVVAELGPFMSQAAAYTAAQLWKCANGRLAWIERREATTG